jgi:hypothetical protein
MQGPPVGQASHSKLLLEFSRKSAERNWTGTAAALYN